MSDAACKTCRFFDRRAEHDPSRGEGVCRIKPPRLRGPRWPTVALTDWCARHETDAPQTPAGWRPHIEYGQGA